jgi:hypothetical protein
MTNARSREIFDLLTKRLHTFQSECIPNGLLPRGAFIDTMVLPYSVRLLAIVLECDHEARPKGNVIEVVSSTAITCQWVDGCKQG